MVARPPRVHREPVRFDAGGKEDAMARFRMLTVRYGLLAALVLSAGAGFKWGR